MRVQECSFQCDRPDCAHGDGDKPSRSQPEINWTMARKAAEDAGWFIRPAESKPEHVCPPCVEEQLLGLSEKDSHQGERKAS